MLETKVTCDGCGNEIRTVTSYSSESYLELKPVWKGHAGGAVFGMALNPYIERPHHFCDINCLEEFCSR